MASVLLRTKYWSFRSCFYKCMLRTISTNTCCVIHVVIVQSMCLQKKEAEKTKGYCEALSNIVLAEFSYLHSQLLADLRTTFGEMLAQQAEFHTAVSRLIVHVSCGAVLCQEKAVLCCCMYI